MEAEYERYEIRIIFYPSFIYIQYLMPVCYRLFFVRRCDVKRFLVEVAKCHR